MITEAAQMFGLLIPWYKMGINFDKIICWATFWAIFSKTHLVTLVVARRRVPGKAASNQNSLFAGSQSKGWDQGLH
jgi:hypothetical protein